MKDAEGAPDGVAGGEDSVAEGEGEGVGSQSLAWSSARMRRKIMSSGTRRPVLMALSASRPVMHRQREICG